jgi:CRISPR-associated endonuclease/helicase Cas3
MANLRPAATDASPRTAWQDLAIFWGKARPPADRPSPSHHPLIFHSLDVAAVGQALLARWPGLATRLAAAFGLEVEAATGLIIRLLALHDLGKFARRFQAKSPQHYDPSFGPIDHVPTNYDHASGGYSLLQSDSGLRQGLPEWPGLSRLAAAVTGHHGAPPRTLPDLRAIFHRHGITAAHAFAGALAPLLPSAAPRLDRTRAVRASFRLAGFAVLCDWIGSNESWFHYQEAEAFESLEHYWAYARQHADRAVTEAGIIPAASVPRRTFVELTGQGFEPSPMQRWAAEVELPEGPLLAVLEDETGSGKTEAALMLAHRLIASGRAEGIYIALPTMATANAMFERLSAGYRNLFTKQTEPSIALVHGRRDLVPAFREASLAGGRVGDRYDDRHEDPTASAACAEWIADDRRRAFLADVGAGTIDQAALAVLPSRYQSLRLFGLGRSVVVVDEIHAYDDYVRELIVALLEFHASQGGSAILLSATLPAAIRADFVRAFARGAGAAGEDDPAPCYPRATLWSPNVMRADHVCGRADRARTVPVRFLPDGESAVAAVAAAAEAGAAVLYLRNTVRDAHDAQGALAALGFDPMLFHSQFALFDRLEIERRVLTLFGANSTPEQRRGRILVATQVAEQSLDLDFDVVITDLAPIDLIIQRAGRLWRHARPERTGAPELLVVSPDPDDEPDPDWYARLFRRGAFVYRHHGRLWLTARMLREAAAIRSPEGLRELVEAVYGDAAVMPSGLEERSWAEEGREGAAAGFGRQNVLKLGNGYDRGGGLWDTEERTPTRLVDEEQVTLRLARVEAGEVVPWAPIEDADIHRGWRLSEVNIARRRISGEAVPPGLSEAARQAKAVWTRYDQEKLLVALRNEGGRWLGAVSSEDRPREVSYSSRWGLISTPETLSSPDHGDEPLAS